MTILQIETANTELAIALTGLRFAVIQPLSGLDLAPIFSSIGSAPLRG